MTREEQMADVVIDAIERALIPIVDRVIYLEQAVGIAHELPIDREAIIEAFKKAFATE